MQNLPLKHTHPLSKKINSQLRKELLFIILFGLLLFYPTRNVQFALSQGDHGRELYAAQSILRGNVPYQDFWWNYGPLMPYYYAFFYKFLGSNIQAILMGEIVLKVLAGAVFFLTLRIYSPLIWALTGTLWFWIFFPFFFYTYNHTGGVVLLLATVYFIFVYIKRLQPDSLYKALACIFLLSFIKLNQGLCALFSFIMAVCLIDTINKIPLSSKKLFYFLSAVCCPIAILGIHYLIVKDLPLYAIKESFPYFGSNRQYNTSIFSSMKTFLVIHFRGFIHSWQTLVLGCIIIISACNTFIFIIKRRLDKTESREIALIVLTLVTFYLTHTHEFFLSGVYYRLLWPMPLMMLLTFILLFTGTRYYSKFLKFLILFLLSILLATQYCVKLKLLNLTKKPQYYFAHKHGQIYLGNSPAWINTVTQTTSFLETRLAKDEIFLALPYDPLYYYLTSKPSPTRQLVFFNFSQIPPKQEKKIIHELETKRVHYIVLSSRCSSTEAGLGTFGETYCPLLAKYVYENFVLTKEYGDWERAPGWNTAHATRLYQKRILD